MFVYAHWTINGHQLIQAFHKKERAVQYVYDQISSYVANEERHYTGGKYPTPGYKDKKVPDELLSIRTTLTAIYDKMTFEDAVALIDRYEDYCRHVLGQGNPMHVLKNIQVVE